MAVNKNFVVKNGFEVSTDLILADATTNKVGIGTSIPSYELHVNGGIGATSATISGFTTSLEGLRVGTAGTTLTVLAVPGIGFSVGVGSSQPAYLLDVRSPVSTGQTALYVQGDVRITGDLNVDDIVFDDATVQDLRIQNTLYVGADGGTGVSTFVGFTTFQNNVYIAGITTLAANGGITTTGGDLYIGGNLYSDGGITVDTDLYIIGIATVGTLDVNNNANVDGNLLVTGVSTFVGVSTFQDYVYIQDGLNISGVTTISNTTDSTTYNNGALVIDGGLGVEKSVNIGGDLDVTGNVYIGGTTVSLRGTDVFIENKDIVLGFTTTITPNDDTANHAGVAIASTEGTPLVNFEVSGINTLPSTYKQMMWFRSGTLGFSTDAFGFNYGVAIGTTTMANGVRLAVGSNVTVTDTTVASSNLLVSGISTLGSVKVSSGVVTATTGIVTYYGDGSYLTGNARNLTATIGIGTSGVAVGYGVSFLDLRGPGLSTVTVDSNVGVATIYFQGGGSGSASIGIGTTPGEAFVGVITAGNLWYNSNLGRLFIYYQDNDSAQWVDAAPFNVGIITSLDNATVSFAPGSASSPSMHFVGDIQTGFFSPGAGEFTVVSLGSSILNINPSGINVTGIITSTRLSTGNVVSSGIVTAQDFDALSDQNYKENVTTVNNALLKVEQLRGVKFDWKESGLPSYGVIAQELEQVLPELVHGNDPKTVNYNGIIGVLIEAIKELKAEVEELKNAK